MLKPVKTKTARASGGAFVIVASRYNARYVDAMLRGATTHAQHIGEAVSNALVQIQIEYEVPVIHQVLLLENESQAKERCLSRKHNRGTEAAQTALEMARVMKSLQG